MKYLLVLTILAAGFTSEVKAQARRYCNCYHKEGDSIITSIMYGSRGEISELRWQEDGDGGRPLDYRFITNPREVLDIMRRYIPRPNGIPTQFITAAEVYLLKRNPTNMRERSLVNFFDARGRLIYISEDWGGRIRQCDGSPTGLKSFCRND